MYNIGIVITQICLLLIFYPISFISLYTHTHFCVIEPFEIKFQILTLLYMLQPTSSENKSVILQIHNTILTPKECKIDKTISDNLYQIYIQISPNALIMSIRSCYCFNARSKQKSFIAFSFHVFFIWTVSLCSYSFFGLS